MSKARQRIEIFSKRRFIWSVVLGVAFALVHFTDYVTHDLPFDFESTCRYIFVLIGAFFLCYGFFAVLEIRGAQRAPAPLSSPVNREEKLRRRRFLICSGLCMFICWAIMYALYWPLASMNDSHWIFVDPVGASTQHPLGYGAVLYVGRKIGLLLGHPSWGFIGLSMTQMFAWLAALIYILWLLSRVGASRAARIVLVLYLSFSPIVANYTFSMVKDAAFSLTITLLIPVLLLIWYTRGQVLRRWPFALLSFVALVGFAVFRNNGLIVVLFVLLAVVVWANRARKLSIVFACTVVLVSLVPTLYSNYRAGSPRFVESVSIPLQQIGYAQARGNGCLSPSLVQKFDPILEHGVWVEAYNDETVDATKFHPEFHWEYLQEHRGDFVKWWGEGLTQCPTQYVKAYLLHTRVLWRIDAPHPTPGGQTFFVSAVTNRVTDPPKLLGWYARQGVVNHSLLPEAADEPLSQLYAWGLSATPGSGAWVWAAVLAIAGFVYCRRGEWLPVFLPSILVWATLMAAAPTVWPFRYSQYWTVVVPVAYVLLLATPGIRRSETRPRSKKLR